MWSIHKEHVVCNSQQTWGSKPNVDKCQKKTNQYEDSKEKGGKKERKKPTSIINEVWQTTAVHTSLHCRKARTEG